MWCRGFVIKQVVQLVGDGEMLAATGTVAVYHHEHLAAFRLAADPVGIF